MNRRLRLSSSVLGALAFASLVGTAQTADAGRFAGGVHFGGGAHFGGGMHWSGGVHVGGGFHYGGGYHFSRPYGGGYYGGYRGSYWGGGYRPYWGVRGHIWVGGYWPYYYYPSYYYPEYVPSYYGTSYYPVQPTYAAPGVTEVVAPRPELPKLGIGLFAGGVNTDYNTATNTSETDVGVIGRYRLTDGLLVEGELGKVSTSVTNPDGSVTDNVRVDRRLGGALIYEIGAYNRLAPYVLGGLGVEQASVNGDYSTTQDYAELGVGLRLAVTDHFHITFDVRAGQRTSVSDNSTTTALPPNTTASMVAPPTSSSTNPSEDYTRARLSAILYF
ncbi:MAG: outer membrane beta-barrel protein [Acidobacteriota bacterium]